MRWHSRRSLFTAVVASLLLAGVLFSAVAPGQLGASTQTQGQLAALVGVAQTSKAYAASAVEVAASNGLDVSAAQAQITQGDSLLATAQTDAQSGSNISAGILAVQTAMGDFTYAATAASVAMNNAHLTASVTYAAAAGAVAEVNASASTVSSVIIQACAGASGSSSPARACANVRVDIASAAVELRQATSLLIQSNGTASASVDYSQVLSLVASARAEVNAAQPGLATIAASTYSVRGQAFVASVVLPLSAQANGTIKSEQAVYANVTQFQTTFNAYAQSQAAASASIVSSVSALATAIAQVNTESVTTSITAAQHTATEVELNMSALLGLISGTLFPKVVTDIHTCSSDAASYDASLGSAESQSSAYSQTQLSSFSAYDSTMSSDSNSAQTAGSAYASSCATVVSDISALFTIPGVQAIYNLLVDLQISGSVNNASASLQQETSAMATVLADITSANSIMASASGEVLLGPDLVATAGSLSTQASLYLNSTGKAALSAVATSMQATAQAAQSFVSSASASLQTTVSGFAASATALSSAGTSLDAQAQASASSTVLAAAYVNGDISTRTSEVTASQLGVSQALQLFSSLNVSGGGAAMAQACLELQAASTVSA